jgi:hypothetical protein
MTIARVQVSIAGGGVASGLVPCAFGETVAITATDTTGWTAALWELPDFPPGLTLPTGWSLGVNGLYYFAPPNPTTPPPVITWPGTGVNNWGKLPIRLRVNNCPLLPQVNGVPSPGYDPTLIDTGTIVSVVSPNKGMPGICATEAGQADALRQWAGQIMASLRLVD